MKNIKQLSFTVLFSAVLCGCQLRHFSPSGFLKNGLETKNLSMFQKSSTKIAESYIKYDSDTALSKKIRKFSKGYYVVKLKDVKKSLEEELKRVDYASKKVYTEKDRTKDDIELTVYEVDNRLDPSYTDKLMYLIFLDDKRVLYHSPYLKNTLKSGDIGKVSWKDFPRRSKKGKLKKQKKYTRKTDSFFKLGDVEYAYNSVMRGYYKITKDSILMWFERETDKKNRIRLLRMDFSYEFDKRWNLVNELSFKHAMINDTDVAIDQTFNKDSITFEYDEKPFRLLLVSDKVNDKGEMEKLIIQDIDIDNGKRKYKVKRINKRENVFIEESLDNIFTF